MFEGDVRRKALTLGACCFALFMAMLDNTVVNVALPTLSRKLGADVSGLQWIVDGYVLAFASLLLTGGIMGDRFGRKKMFLGGLSVFTLASLACGLSASTGQLVAFRALQGVGAAVLMPGTLAILTVTFPSHERAKAIGIWAGVSGLALSLGPTAGGWLVEHVGWESIFFLNVPIGVVAFVTAATVVRESVSPEARRLDLAGLGLGTAGLFLGTYGLIEANERSWGDWHIVGALAFAGIFLGCFVAWELYNRHAMMPLHFFAIPAFSAGNVVAFAVSFGMFGTFFFVSLFMQFVRGYTPFQAGVRFLPMTGMILFAAPTAGRIAQKYGSRWPMTVGPLLAAAGLLGVSRSGPDTSYAFMAPFLVVMGIGMGSTMTPMTAAVMNAVGPARAGMGSAMTNTSRETGGVFGVALLGTLLSIKLRSVLTGLLATTGIEPAIRGLIIAGAGHGRMDPRVLRGLGPQGAVVQRAFGQAFTQGFRLTLIVAAGMLVCASLVANRFVPSGPPRAEHVPTVERDGELALAAH
jgi:EmrB/QacA subfamily drug resistance transporter